MRLIDADAWDAFYADMGDSHNMMDSYDRGYTDALDNADDWMDAQPTIDAVPVVRCKDCHYSDEAKVNEKGFLICPASGMEITDNDFCSYGERRSDE